MVLVDDREGSKKLIEPLKRIGLPVESTRLEYGDIGFVGRGANGASLSIGVEYKQVGELITSIRDGRFAGGQLPGMRNQYDHAWLLVEGQWRSNESGQMTTYQGRYRGWQAFHGKMSAVEFEKHLLTFELCGGVSVRFTNSQQDTVRFLLALYRWWTSKDLDEHSSHIAVHTPHTMVPLSDFRQAVYRFPGIGIKTSWAVEQHFNGCLRDAVNASVEEWADISTEDKNGHSKRIGKKVASDIVEFLTRRVKRERRPGSAPKR